MKSKEMEKSLINEFTELHRSLQGITGKMGNILDLDHWNQPPKSIACCEADSYSSFLSLRSLIYLADEFDISNDCITEYKGEKLYFKTMFK